MSNFAVAKLRESGRMSDTMESETIITYETFEEVQYYGEGLCGEGW